jgi:hypothetical protein
VFGAGLAPVRGLDAPGTTSVAVALEAPPAEPAYVASGTALVLLITVAFTIAAGVSSFAVDFAKAATTVF